MHNPAFSRIYVGIAGGDIVRTRRDSTDTWQGKLRTLGIGIAVALVTGAVCLVLAALLMTFLDMSPTAVTVLSVIAAAVSAFVGGFTAARVAGHGGWLAGLLVGGVLFAVILITGLILYRNIRIGFLFVKLAVLLLGGMAGGMVGVK